MPSRYTVQLILAPGYQATLGREPREFQLGFQYRKGTLVLKRGDVPCHLHAKEPMVHVTLPNVERISAREIHLHLAH